MKSRKIAIVLSVSMLVPSFSFADSFSYDNAVKTAIKNNLQLERTADTLDDINNSIYSGNDTANEEENTLAKSLQSSISYDNMLNAQKTTKIDYDAQKDAITLNVKNLFLKIEYLEKNRALLKEKLAKTSKKISIDRIKYEKGVLSKIDYHDSQMQLDKVKNEQKENELNIQMAYKDLQNVVNSKNINAISYIDVKYTPVNTLNISKQYMIGKAIGNSTSIISQNNSIKTLEEQIKYGLLDYTNSTLPSEESSKSIALKDVNVRITKQNIENAVLETANTIESMELNIKNIKKGLQNLNTSEKNLQNKVRLGVSTKQELEDVKFSIKEQNLMLENAINEHQMLLEKYQKPYLLSLN